MLEGGAYLFIALCFGLAGGFVGRSKGSPFWIWFLVAAIIPFAGLAAAVLYRNERDEPRRACPNCGRVCKVYEAICLQCGTELAYPRADEILAPESQRTLGPLVP